MCIQLYPIDMFVFFFNDAAGGFERMRILNFMFPLEKMVVVGKKTPFYVQLLFFFLFGRSSHSQGCYKAVPNLAWCPLNSESGHPR